MLGMGKHNAALNTTTVVRVALAISKMCYPPVCRQEAHKNKAKDPFALKKGRLCMMPRHY